MTIPENSRSLLKINSNVGHIVCLKLKIKTKFAYVLNELKVHSIKILPAQYLLGAPGLFWGHSCMVSGEGEVVETRSHMCVYAWVERNKSHTRWVEQNW